MSPDDISKKSRIFQTLTLFLVAIYTGCVFASIGPTLPDLQIVFNVGLGKASFLILAYGLGEMLGVCMAWIFSSRMNNYLLMTVTLIIGISAFCCIPLAGSVYGAVVCIFTCTTATGLLVVARMHQTSLLWPESSTAFHLLYAGVSLGSVLDPFIANPFVCVGNCHICLINTSVSTNLTITDPNEEDICSQSAANMTHFFLIVGCMHIPTVCCLTYYYLKMRNHEFKKYERLPESISELTQKGKVLIHVFLFLSYFTSSGSLATLGSLLSTFGIRSQMHFSATYMADMTSVFWASVLSGRILGTLVSRFLTPFKIIMLSFGGLWVSMIVFGAAEKYVVPLWLAVTAFGLFSSPFFASLFAWIREHTTLSKALISQGYIGATSGYAIAPFLGGILINQMGPNIFKFYLGGVLTFQCVAFGSLYIVVQVLMKGNTMLTRKE